jgi:hypothetical protein
VTVSIEAMETKEHPQAINLFFGSRHSETLAEFDELTKHLRRSRTGTLHFLLSHYRWYEKHKLTSV